MSEGQLLAEQQGFVYFVQAGPGGPIKIGIAQHPKWRFDALQVGHHAELVLLKLTHGARRMEAAIHERFRHLHIRGEWYEPAADLLEFVAGLADVSPVAPALSPEPLGWKRTPTPEAFRQRIVAEVEGIYAAAARQERLASPESRRRAAIAFAAGGALARLTKGVRQREAQRGLTPAQADPRLYAREGG